MDSNRALIDRHRRARPGAFTANDGQRMSDRDDCRLWDMLWRIIKARHSPAWRYSEADCFHEFPYPDHETPRRDARTAAGRLASWYRVRYSPHASFADVH